MIKEIWFNLPVKNVKLSREFFSKLGFQFNTAYGDTDHSACLVVGSKNMIIMLFEESIFRTFSKNLITNTETSNELLISFDAQSREEVDQMAERVRSAGGIIYGEPNENQGWMYGFGFCDPDGHRWNMLYMDFEKMPKNG